MRGERPAADDGRIVDREDFEAAFRRYFPPVYRFIAGRVGSAVAEDLAAETFATAYRRRAMYEPGRGSLRSWLYAWAELSHEEIASALQIALGTAWSRLSRARALLRERLGDFDFDLWVFGGPETGSVRGGLDRD